MSKTSKKFKSPLLGWLTFTFGEKWQHKFEEGFSAVRDHMKIPSVHEVGKLHHRVDQLERRISSLAA